MNEEQKEPILQKNGNEQLNKVVMEKIKHDSIKMKSRSYFVLKSILIIAGLVFMFAVGFFLISFIFFVYNANALGELGFFGRTGIGIMLKSLPWILIIASLIIIVSLELLAKHYEFVYKRPLVYTSILLICILVFGGLMLGKLEFHERAYELAQKQRMPLIGSFYNKLGAIDFDDVYFGKVINVEYDFLPKTFVMITAKGDTVTVQIGEKMPNRYLPTQGDKIMVIGEFNDDGIIIARGIKPLQEKSILKKHMINKQFRLIEQ